MKFFTKTLGLIVLAVFALTLQAQTPPAGYCASYASSTFDEEILYTQIHTLGVSSNCSSTGGAGSVLNRYSNYYGMFSNPNLSGGSTYYGQVNWGQCGSSSWSGGFRTYCDFNHNFSLNDASELLYTSPYVSAPPSGVGYGYNFFVPTGYSSSTTLFRALAYETNPTNITSCYLGSWGETEDFSVNYVSACGSAPTFVTTLPATSAANRYCDNAGKKLLTVTSPAGYTATWSSSSSGVITTSGGNYYVNPGAVSLDPTTGLGQATITMVATSGPCVYTVNYTFYVKCCGSDIAQVLGAGNDGKADYYTITFNCKNTSYTYLLTGGGPVTFTKVNKVLMVNHNCNNYSVRITACGCPKNFNGGTSCKDDGSIATASLTCYPNPVNEHTTVSFTTAMGGNIETGIYNVNGQQVMQLFKGSLAAGETVNLPLEANLSAGIYFVRMVSDNGENVVQKVMVK
ncbi:MAG: T9SS type A sorting domain-containing protein [Sphingobacteriales bacterium]|nr:T9SS type A sorting domain-containing protein [Sphingobacteriales bacterium]MBK8679679.1 T9SS type A sorting domain-containing protein [Sphingobacteriales bacterium]